MIETTQKIDGKTFINGVDTATICRRNGYGSRPHEQIAAIHITAPKDIAAKIVESLDEPAALVSPDKACTLVLFRRDRTDVGRKIEFHIDGKCCSIEIIDDYKISGVESHVVWTDGRSPSTVHRNLLPPLLRDHVELATEAVHKMGARIGSASDFAAEAQQEARYEKLRADIAASGLTAEAYIERQEADRLAAEDDAIVAQYEGHDFTQFDGAGATLIMQARARVRNRKRLALESAIA